jgi:hypothetical protein
MSPTPVRRPRRWRRAPNASGASTCSNNAGYGLFGAVEEVCDAEARALFDTNVFDLLNVTRAALPVLRSQEAGHVINMSSSAGFAASGGRGLYGASKAAVEAITVRQLAAAPEPPLRLQLGSDCVTLVEGKLASVAAELSQWRDLALSTDFAAA